MDKKAVILHGTDASPEVNWFPWLKNLLSSSGVKVWLPLLPENHTPNRFTYDEFLRAASWDFRGNLVVGHSSGATTLLSLLQSDWFPPIDAAVLVGTFLNEKLTKSAEWYDEGQFDNLFPEKFDIEKIKSKAKRFYFIHGSVDPYCDVEDAKTLCKQLSGTFIEIPAGLHLGSDRKELPEVLPVLEDTGYKSS